MYKPLPTAALLATVLLTHGAGAETALPDPTRPSGQSAIAPAAQEAGPAPRLESTLISPQRRLAVIDGRMVRPGDRVGDARVLDIQPDRVTLRRADRTVHLRLLPEQTKKRQQP